MDDEVKKWLFDILSSIDISKKSEGLLNTIGIK